eukprot:CAMPEP_0170538678 /NCGR_PEP_ID=MMETSP0209-20121228/103463_1 /TAXON_ID=665100 ORGANISM="Litonotus pictus, Strain P1" /NCGR_SAMPLE_ID=MMETSP0209 /ASSEMBLY_ACC=CAM_ASM_000301 /LENGTH=554 /DNA_ID=CAMNT_0010840431 /DNA_START=244 /DNA_END=1905 /DNA_ORIENTATION=+
MNNSNYRSTNLSTNSNNNIQDKRNSQQNSLVVGAHSIFDNEVINYCREILSHKEYLQTFTEQGFKIDIEMVINDYYSYLLKSWVILFIEYYCSIKPNKIDSIGDNKDLRGNKDSKEVNLEQMNKEERSKCFALLMSNMNIFRDMTPDVSLSNRLFYCVYKYGEIPELKKLYEKYREMNLHNRVMSIMLIEKLSSFNKENYEHPKNKNKILLFSPEFSSPLKTVSNAITGTITKVKDMFNKKPNDCQAFRSFMNEASLYSVLNWVNKSNKKQELYTRERKEQLSNVEGNDDSKRSAMYKSGYYEVLAEQKVEIHDLEELLIRNKSSYNELRVKMSSSNVKESIDSLRIKEEITFFTLTHCLECNGVLELDKVCTRYFYMTKDIQWTECYLCHSKIFPKLSFRIRVLKPKETETNPVTNSNSKNNVNKGKHSTNEFKAKEKGKEKITDNEEAEKKEDIIAEFSDKIMLYSPFFLYQNLKASCSNESHFNSIVFRNKYSSIYLNCLWYFNLINLPINFFQPKILIRQSSGYSHPLESRVDSRESEMRKVSNLTINLE